MLDRFIYLLHWLGFAAFIGAAVAQQHFMAASARGGVLPAVRDEYEKLSAAIVTKIELPALIVQVLSGVMFIAQNSGWMRMGWLHGKLTAVLILLVLAHLEMFNARAVAKLRQQRGDTAADEIAKRKKRHVQFGVAGTIAVVAVLGLVAFGR